MRERFYIGVGGGGCGASVAERSIPGVAKDLSWIPERIESEEYHLNCIVTTG